MMYSVGFKYGKPKQFDTLAKACNWAASQFDNQKEWAQRFNKNSMLEIERCLSEISQIKADGFDGVARVYAVLDDLTDTRVELVFVDMEDVQPNKRQNSSAARDSAA